MADSINIYTLLALLGCTISGALSAWLLYRRTPHLESRIRYALIAARAVAIATITFLLFAPLIRRISYQLEKPVIVIGQDNSLSTGTIFPQTFNQKQYKQDLQALADKLSDKYEVKIYHFSDSVKAGFNFEGKGKLSNASMFINQLNDELLNRNVGAVVLATDGIFNRGGSPLYDLDKLRAPVYTIALGDTVPKKDLLIANVNYNNLAYLGNEFILDIQVQAFQSKGERSRLSILENGKKVHEEAVLISGNPYEKSVAVKLKASKLGIQKFTIQLNPLSTEISEQNNRQQVNIEVIDARQKILILAAAPHPDIAALRQVLSANKHYDLKVVVGDEVSKEELKDYGLIILYQMPNVQLNTSGINVKLQQGATLLWYIIGAQSDLRTLSSMQQSLNYTGTNATLHESFSYAAPNITAFDLPAEAIKQIEGFDPLQSPFGNVQVSADATVLLNQRTGKVKTGKPQLFFTNENGRKTGFLIGEGIWRWKLAEAKDEATSGATARLVSGVVQYLSVKDDKRKFKAYTLKNTFEENENIVISATLYNDSYTPVNTPEVSLELKNELGKSYNFQFSKTDVAYTLEAGSFPAGVYSYTAKTVLGSKEHQAKGVFYVNALVAEYQQTVANHQLLNSMSVETNGKMYMPSDLNRIFADITANDEIKTVSYEQRRYDELINFKWIFVLILILLSTEWFLRKRNGEI